MGQIIEFRCNDLILCAAGSVKNIYPQRAVEHRAHLRHRCASFDQKCSQDRAMAMTFISAIASDREVSSVRQGGEQVQGMTCCRRGHLGLVFSRERVPLCGRLCRLPELHRFYAGSQDGEPDVVPVLRCKFALGTPRGGRRTVPMRTPPLRLVVFPV